MSWRSSAQFHNPPHLVGGGDVLDAAFRPELMSPEELRLAHRGLWQRAFSPSLTAHRLWRGARTLGRGGFLLSAAMNGFYGLEGITGNLPADAPEGRAGAVAHPRLAPVGQPAA